VFTDVPAPPVSGVYAPIAGDFDGNGIDDIYWYRPGTGTDYLWTGTPTGFSSSIPRQVTGTYTPVRGDYDGNGRDDIHWYRPGTGTDYLWWSAAGPFSGSEVAATNL
jgi:hypothetical protein